MRAIRLLSFLLPILLISIQTTVAVGSRDTLAQTLVNVEIKDLPMSDAIQLLFKGTNIKYTVAPEICQLKVSAVVKNVPLEKALQELCRAAGATYRLRGDEVSIVARPPMAKSSTLGRAHAAGYDYNTNAVAPAASNVSQRIITTNVPLNNVYSNEIAPIAEYNGVQMQSTNSGIAVLTGPEDQVKQAANIIQALDNDNVQPKPMRVTIKAKVTWTGSSGKPQSSNVSATIRAINGQSIEQQMNSSSLTNGGIKANVKLTPSINVDGKISLIGALKYDWNTKDAMFGQVNMNCPNLVITTSLEPGKEQNVSSMTMGTSNGGEAVMDVTAVAIVEEGTINQAPSKAKP